MTDSSQSSHVELAFDEYALKYVVLPGQQYSTGELLESAGLPGQRPQPIDAMIESAHDIAYDAIAVGRSNDILHQWNPYSGTWPVHVIDPLGGRASTDHRWLIQIFEASTRCLYDTLHELAHGQLALIGQLGLLTHLPEHERLKFHTACEAVAVIVGDLAGQAALRRTGYLSRFWPPSLHLSHAVRLNPVDALHGAGCTQIEDQAAWIFDVYLRGRETLPHLPDSPEQRALALAFLAEESAYARKANRVVGHHWEEHYWRRADIDEFLQDFVPPAPVSLPHLKSPIEQIADIEKHWHALTLGWVPLEPKHGRYVQARCAIQRRALKVCEMLNAIGCVRCRLSDPKQDDARLALHTARATLVSIFQTFASPAGYLDTQGLDALLEHLNDLMNRLIDRLCSIIGPVLFMSHPWLDDIAISDDDLDFALPTGVPSRQAGELIKCLDKLSQEALIGDRHTQGHSPNALIFGEATTLKSKLQLERDNQSLCAHVEAWLSQQKARGDLTLAYPLSWIRQYPFIEPAIGFRFQ